MSAYQRRLVNFIAIALPLLLAASSHAADVTNLRCEYRENPLGIDVTRPRLSWQMEIGGQESGGRGQRQTAYQVLVASTPELLAKDQGDLWDSGKVASDRSVAIPYGGPALESGKTCHWRVRVWDGKGTVSPWSDTALASYTDYPGSPQTLLHPAGSAERVRGVGVKILFIEPGSPWENGYNARVKIQAAVLNAEVRGWDYGELVR